MGLVGEDAGSFPRGYHFLCPNWLCLFLLHEILASWSRIAFFSPSILSPFCGTGGGGTSHNQKGEPKEGICNGGGQITALCYLIILDEAFVGATLLYPR